MVRRCDAFNSRAHRLEQVALKILAEHVHSIVAEILPIWRLLTALREELIDRRQISLVVVHAGGELRGIRSSARFGAFLLLIMLL